MVWWITLLWYVGTTIVSELLRPKPNLENARPSSLGDFQRPTSQEGRVIPLLWGTVVQKGPNLIWFGDLEAVAITEKVKTGLFSSDTITKGFRYFLGMQLALCRGELAADGVDGIRRIWVDSKLVRDAAGSPPVFSPVVSGNISISRPDFTGEDSNLVGTLQVLPGSSSQAVNAYLSAVVVGGATELPAYRGTAYAVWPAGEIGTSPTLQPWKFEVTRIPNGLSLSGSPNMSRIWEDGVPHANPMNVLYEILTDDDWGASVSPSLIDTTSFVDVATTLYTEGNGYSLILDNPKDIGSMIEEIERQTDGVLLLNESTGLYEYRLAREVADSPDLTRTVDESNCVSVDFSRTSWENTINEVRVPFNSPQKDYAESFAIAADGANFKIQGANVSSTTRFPGVKQGSLAAKLAWRELRFMSYPLSKATLRVDRTFYDAVPTELIDLTWGPLGISNVRYRITKVNVADVDNGLINLEVLEDIFQTEISTFADPITSRWTPVSSDPVQPIAATMFELPKPMQTASGTQVGICCVRGNSLQVSYDVYTTDVDAGGSPVNNTSDADFTYDTTVSTWTPSGLLTVAMNKEDEFVSASPPAEMTFDTGVDIDVVIADGSAVLADVLASNITHFLRIDGEIIFYEGIVDEGGGDYRLTGIHRGMMDTIPADHSVGARIFFISLGIGRIPADDATYPLSITSLAIRIASTTPAKTISLANASEASIQLTHAFGAEAPPADPQVNNDPIFNIGESNSPINRTCGSLTFEAKGRNLTTQQADGANIDQSGAHVEPEGGTGYVVDVYRADQSPAVLVFRRTGIPSAGDTVSPEGIKFNMNSADYIIAGDIVSPSQSPERALQNFYVEMYSRKGGVDSQHWISNDFTVIGYGLDYGSAYGGLCDAGVNLKQGDPPFVTEPVPGTGQLRRWLITVGGTVGGANDDHHFFGFFFDSLEGTSSFFGIDIDGGAQTTVAEVVTHVSGELTALLPSTFNVDVVGSEITVSTEFGNFSMDPAFGNGDLSIRYGSLLQEEQLGAQVTVNRGMYGSDFFSTQFINGANVDILGPSLDLAYSKNGTYRHELVIRGLTYDARKALDFGLLSADAIATVAISETLVSSYKLTSNNMITSLQGSAIASIASNISSVLPTDVDRVPDRTPVVTVTLLDNFVAYSGGQVYQQAEPQPSVPYRLVWKELDVPQIFAPSGLPRTYWLGGTGVAVVDGMLFEVEFNGAIVATHTVGSPLSTIAEINADLAAQVDANGSLSSEVLSANSRVEVQGGLQVNYDLQFYVGLGLRLKFEEL